MSTDRPLGPPGASAPGERLESWKEIGAYLGRTPRTVQRWERSEGLPVHRLPHDKLGSVYAYRAELDAWWGQRRQRLAADARDDVDAAPILPQVDGSGPRRSRAWRGLVLVVLVAGAAIVAYRAARSLPLARPVRIAVLPFENLGGDPARDYVSDGFTEELITAVGRLQPKELAVIARTSVMRYKRAPAPVSRIGAELGVSYVLEGSLRSEGEVVRIAARLVRVTDQTPLWEDVYERPVRDLLPVEREVSRRVAGAILRELGGGFKAPPPSARPTDPLAHEAYLKGRYFWNTRTDEGLRQSLVLFEEAATRDPSYAEAHAGIADAYMLLANYGAMPAREAFPKAEEAVERALALDPDLAEARASRAFLLRNHRWDFAGSEEEFQRAIGLRPNLAVAHYWYGILLEMLGRFEEARAEATRARALDPLSTATTGFLADIGLAEGRYEDAVLWSRRVLEIEPDHSTAYLSLGRALALQGRTDEAIEDLKRAASKSNGHPMVLAVLGNVYGRAGRIKEAKDVEARLLDLSKERYVAPFYWATLDAGLGNRDAAMRELEKVYADRHVGILSICTEPELEPLSADPRFQALARRVGLPADGC
jgi:TolB-like protein/tetratricopeptide (TPR) repeat protein